jgi:hypothetical protein
MLKRRNMRQTLKNTLGEAWPSQMNVSTNNQFTAPAPAPDPDSDSDSDSYSDPILGDRTPWNMSERDQQKLSLFSEGKGCPSAQEALVVAGLILSATTPFSEVGADSAPRQG